MSHSDVPDCRPSERRPALAQTVRSADSRYFSPQTQKKEVFACFDVSRETQQKLEIYVDLLTKWQQKINLVSSSTLSCIWQRHVLDCGQLIFHLPKSGGKLMDVGAGAGLPGLILAMLTDYQVHLVEADAKKVAFMRTVITETGIDAVLHHDRIETLAKMSVDVITARALAPLSRLIELTKAQHHDDLAYFFFKGKGVNEELNELSSRLTFVVNTYPSVTDRDAAIVHLKNKK